MRSVERGKCGAAAGRSALRNNFLSAFSAEQNQVLRGSIFSSFQIQFFIIPLPRIGGYPFIIDATEDVVKGYFYPGYTMEEMEQVNRNSIYCDGIENVLDGYLLYTDELINKVRDRFNVVIPKNVFLSEAEKIAELLINKIIKRNSI